MEKRSHPRVQLPLLVELAHPTLGKRRCTARDISEGGLFVNIDDHPITNGAKLKLTLLNPNQVDQQPTPTVDMTVTRIESDGLGLKFINQTSRHLWQSVKRQREELQVGRDYFQVYVAAIAMNEDGGILIVQEHGKWMFPGHYLVVGEDWRSAITSVLSERFGLKGIHVQRLCDMSSSRDHDLPEAAAMKLYVQMAVDDSEFSVTETSPYRDQRWISRRRDIEELTFSGELERDLATEAMDWFQT